MTQRKPNTQQAMQQLISTIEQQIPLNIAEAAICQGKCCGCPKKMLEMLDSELSYWRSAVPDITPGFADLKQLEKLARRTHRLFCKNGLITA
ncbi:hypothetical protein L9G15_16325 [Shewanella sp. A3A]|nr:hypothetical protein [Shewanella ferrihydritica]